MSSANEKGQGCDSFEKWQKRRIESGEAIRLAQGYDESLAKRFPLITIGRWINGKRVTRFVEQKNDPVDLPTSVSRIINAQPQILSHVLGFLASDGPAVCQTPISFSFHSTLFYSLKGLYPETYIPDSLRGKALSLSEKTRITWGTAILRACEEGIKVNTSYPTAERDQLSELQKTLQEVAGRNSKSVDRVVDATYKIFENKNFPWHRHFKPLLTTEQLGNYEKLFPDFDASITE